ncbi:phage tail protein [Providencia rettgeri]
MKYFALLTKLGENLLAQATALGTKLELTHMAVGDGGGSLPTPDTNQTKLIAEKRRAAINTLFIDDKNKNQIIAEQIIPEQDGGWWIREIGLFDKASNLIAVANCPETYKPQLAEGSGRTQSIRIVLIVSHTESVTLKIDPSVVLATREYVNTEITVLDKKIDALSAQTKLDLNKKFDKANISGQKGNDNDKVPSLNLFTIEISKLAALGYSYSKIESDGRYQPKGNYAPAGDYATNAALNNGLNQKFDKTGGRVAGGIISEGNINAEGGLITAIKNNTFVQLKATDAGKPALLSSPDNKQFNTHNLQNKSGTIMHIGDCGFGGLGEQLDQSDWNSIKALIAENKSRIYNSRSNNELNGRAAYAPMFLMQIGNTWANISINHINGRMTVSAGYNDFKTITTVYSTANTSTDRNGYLRTSSTTAEMQSIPIGASVLWNTSAPIPANFWPNEGRSFSAAEYPELAKIFTDLKLPDDRGYAIRAADNGRGIDVGRTVGTYQQDAVQKITGDIATSGIENTSATGAFSARTTDEFTNGHYASSARPPNRAYINFDSSRVARTADETRMKNVAKILITRVK